MKNKKIKSLIFSCFLILGIISCKNIVNQPEEQEIPENETEKEKPKTYLKIINNSQYDINVFFQPPTYSEPWTTVKSRKTVTNEVFPSESKAGDTIYIQYLYSVEGITIPYYDTLTEESLNACIKIKLIEEGKVNEITVSKLSSLTVGTKYIIIKNDSDSDIAIYNRNAPITPLYEKNYWIVCGEYRIYEMKDISSLSGYTIGTDLLSKPIGIDKIENGNIYTIRYENSKAELISITPIDISIQNKIWKMPLSSEEGKYLTPDKLGLREKSADGYHFAGQISYDKSSRDKQSKAYQANISPSGEVVKEIQRSLKDKPKMVRSNAFVEKNGWNVVAGSKLTKAGKYEPFIYGENGADFYERLSLDGFHNAIEMVHKAGNTFSLLYDIAEDEKTIGFSICEITITNDYNNPLSKNLIYTSKNEGRTAKDFIYNKNEYVVLAQAGNKTDFIFLGEQGEVNQIKIQDGYLFDSIDSSADGKHIVASGAYISSITGKKNASFIQYDVEKKQFSGDGKPKRFPATYDSLNSNFNCVSVKDTNKEIFLAGYKDFDDKGRNGYPYLISYDLEKAELKWSNFYNEERYKGYEITSCYLSEIGTPLILLCNKEEQKSFIVSCGLLGEIPEKNEGKRNAIPRASISYTVTLIDGQGNAFDVITKNSSMQVYESEITKAKKALGADFKETEGKEYNRWKDFDSGEIITYPIILNRDLTLIPDFKLLPPKNIQISETTVNSVKLTWDENPSASKYRIFYGTSKDKLDNSTEYIIENSCVCNGLKYGTRYYFRIFAYDKDSEDKPSESELITVDTITPEAHINYVDEENKENNFEIMTVDYGMSIERQIINNYVDNHNQELRKKEWKQFVGWKDCDTNERIGVKIENIERNINLTPVFTILPVSLNDISDEDITDNSVKLTWKHNKAASKYEVYCSESKDALNNKQGRILDALDCCHDNSEYCNYTYDNLGFGKTYYFRIRAYDGSPDSCLEEGELWSNWSEPKEALMQVTVTIYDSEERPFTIISTHHGDEITKSEINEKLNTIDDFKTIEGKIITGWKYYSGPLKDKKIDDSIQLNNSIELVPVYKIKTPSTDDIKFTEITDKKLRVSWPKNPYATRYKIEVKNKIVGISPYNTEITFESEDKTEIFTEIDNLIEGDIYDFCIYVYDENDDFDTSAPVEHKKTTPSYTISIYNCRKEKIDSYADLYGTDFSESNINEQTEQLLQIPDGKRFDGWYKETLDENGNAVKEQITLPITITKDENLYPKLKVLPPNSMNIEVTGNNIKTLWNNNAFAGNYKIEWSINNDFSNSLYLNINDVICNINGTENAILYGTKYYLRIYSYDKDTNELSDPSQTYECTTQFNVKLYDINNTEYQLYLPRSEAISLPVESSDFQNYNLEDFYIPRGYEIIGYEIENDDSTHSGITLPYNVPEAKVSFKFYAKYKLLAPEVKYENDNVYLTLTVPVEAVAENEEKQYTNAVIKRKVVGEEEYKDIAYIQNSNSNDVSSLPLSDHISLYDCFTYSSTDYIYCVEYKRYDDSTEDWKSVVSTESAVIKGTDSYTENYESKTINCNYDFDTGKITFDPALQRPAEKPLLGNAIAKIKVSDNLNEYVKYYNSISEYNFYTELKEIIKPETLYKMSFELCYIKDSDEVTIKSIIPYSVDYLPDLDNIEVKVKWIDENQKNFKDYSVYFPDSWDIRKHTLRNVPIEKNVNGFRIAIKPGKLYNGSVCIDDVYLKKINSNGKIVSTLKYEFNTKSEAQEWFDYFGTQDTEERFGNIEYASENSNGFLRISGTRSHCWVTTPMLIKYEDDFSYDLSFKVRYENITDIEYSSFGFDYYYVPNDYFWDYENQKSSCGWQEYIEPEDGFVLVEGGTIVGSTKNSYGTSGKYVGFFRDGRTVTLSSYYICNHEVTQSEYEAFCCYSTSSNPNLNLGIGDNYPVYYVSWYDSIVYCNLRSMAEELTPCYSYKNETDPKKWDGIKELDGKYSYDSDSELKVNWLPDIKCNWNADGYRLPTVAEWEFAARGGMKTYGTSLFSDRFAGATTDKPNAANCDELNNIAWYAYNSSDMTHEVMKKSPNELGLFDMSGNVWEWIWDETKDSYLPEYLINPKGDNEQLQIRIRRGGSWDNQPKMCFVSYDASALSPYYVTNIGIRLVRSCLDENIDTDKPITAPIVLPAGTNGTAGTEATYVLFGNWPQTIKSDDVEIDETIFENHGSLIYYKGSDDCWYVKSLENTYGSDYKYSNNETVASKDSNSYKYFKVEPIKWRVLTRNYNETGKALLLAENILTSDKQYGTISNYLNNTFLLDAFIPISQSLIAETQLDANTNQQTQKKIFLLSKAEVSNSEYGFDSAESSGIGNNRIRITTDFAKANYSNQNINEGFGGWWWLRDYQSSSMPYNVLNNGNAQNDTTNHYNIHYSTYSFGGIVPALTIELE